MEEAGKLSRKEREKLQRRQEILSSACKLFSEKGFRETTLEDIAVDSEYGIGTIYNYFQSKEDIFRSVIQKTLDASVMIMQQADDSTKSAADFMRIYTRDLFRYCIDNKNEFLTLVYFFTSEPKKKNFCKTEYLQQKEENMSSILVKRIDEGIRKGELRTINTEHFMVFFNHLVYPYIMHFIQNNTLMEQGIDEHVNSIIDFVFNGILSK